MHRIRQHVTGGPDVLVLESAPDLVPAEGQVRIAVEVAGVHLVDTTIRRGEWGDVELPMTPGREVAGRVDALGADVEPAWLGRRVVAHLGLASGGYADQAVTEVDRLHVVPAVLTSDTAVAAIGTGRTAAGVLDQAPVTPEDEVVVTAASGGLGALLVRAALAQGARVVGLANGPAKAEVVRRLGAHTVVDVSAGLDPDRVGAPTIVFDGVGGETSQVLFGLLDQDGVLVSYTGEAGDQHVGRGTFRAVLGPSLTARPGGLRALEEEALARAVDGSRVPLVGSTFALADAAGAHRALEARETFGKVVLTTGTGEGRGE
ncbi:MAG: oxidoreductase [Actinomycetales bacterium]|nr:MAG: oxidoreductase [Actinomycetales bacterium]